MPSNSGIRVVRRGVEEFTDTQIEKLIDFGKRESDLIDQMEAAARAGDRELAWQLAQAICDLHDRAQAVR